MVARYLVPRSTAPPFPSGLSDGSKEISGDSRLSSSSTAYVVSVVDVATSLSCENRRSTLNIASSSEEKMLFITASLHMLASLIFMKALYKALAPYLLGMDRRRCRGSASWPRQRPRAPPPLVLLLGRHYRSTMAGLLVAQVGLQISKALFFCTISLFCLVGGRDWKSWYSF
ncbi:hypothetical protein ACQJBY_054197 [Aegilops geniculata]